MPTTYTPIDLAKPSGATQAGTPHSQSTRDNMIAEAIGITVGQLEGYAYSQVVGAGDVMRPDTWYWKSGANWIRSTNTWGTSGGADGNLTQMVIDWSTDNGATWASVKTITYTYDASGALTATSNGGGLASLLAMMWGFIKKLVTHIAGAGTSVHSLGSMSTQAANAVAITGGAIKSTTQQVAVNNIGTVSAPFNIDLSLGHFHTFTVAAGAVATFTNIPASGTVHPVTLRITNGGLVAFNTLFPGTKTRPGGVNPTLTSSGVDDVHGYFRDGTTFEITGASIAKS